MCFRPSLSGPVGFMAGLDTAVTRIVPGGIVDVAWDRLWTGLACVVIRYVVSVGPTIVPIVVDFVCVGVWRIDWFAAIKTLALLVVGRYLVPVHLLLSLSLIIILTNLIVLLSLIVGVSTTTTFSISSAMSAPTSRPP